MLPGGRVTLEDAYAYAKFARMVLRTNDVDARARAHSAEEAAFLGHAVAGTGLSVGYADLEAAPTVLLAGFEPEEESPIVFLRLRKAARRGQRVYAVASWAGRGLDKLGGRLLPAAPGTEAEVLEALVGGMPPGTDDAEDGTSAEDATVARDGAVAAIAEVADALRAEGSVLVVGERLAAVPGALSAARRLARATGARLAWIPRRAGERGAVEAGALPTLLPGGHPVAVAGAREQVARSWGLDDVPADAGRDTAAILAAAADGGLVAAVRAKSDLGSKLSTVDTGGTPMGPVSTVLALSEQLRGLAGDYGFGEGADDVLPELADAGSGQS